MISPNAVLLDFEYDAMHAMKNNWKPAITWLEYVSPWKVRGCVATVGGVPGALRGGKLKWLALYNHTQSSTEQSGVFRMAPSVLTAGKLCMHVDFKQVGCNITFDTDVLAFSLTNKNIIKSPKELELHSVNTISNSTMKTVPQLP